MSKEITATQRKVLFSLLVAAVFLIPLLRAVELPDLLKNLDRIDLRGLGIAFLVLAAANVVRSFRFERLDNGRLGLSRWWIINGLYNVITATFPGGVGEAVTAFAMKKTFQHEFLVSIRILMLCRVMDLGAISLVLLVAALMRGSAGGDVAPGAAFFFLSLSVVLLVPASERFIVSAVRRFLPGKGRFAGSLRSELESLSSAVEEKRDVAPYAAALVCSLLVIVCSAISVHEVLRAVGIDFTWVQSFYCFGVYALFQLIPLQGFAGIGTQAAWWMLALNAAGYESSDAATMGLILHGTFYLFIAALALLSILYWLSWKKRPS